MLNINEKIFEVVDDKEYWVLCHICKRIGKNLNCFPTLSTLRSDTNYGKNKLAETVKSLSEKGLIKRKQRHKKSGEFSSNIYTLTNDFISVYVYL